VTPADKNRETVIDKVRKLIALASSPYEEEARSAAFKAAALIREFQLDVIDPAQRPRRNDDWPRWVEIISRYDGRCKTCLHSYAVGDYVLWKQGVGCIHTDCDEP
jgi:hypothetical protein